MGVEIERIIDGTNFKVGEGPHWDTATQTLYFVDIPEKTIYKYDPDTKKTTSAKSDGEGKSVSFIIPIENAPNKFVISLGKKIVEIFWDGTSDKFDVIKTLGEADADTDMVSYQLNDAKCDNFGKLWTGSVGQSQSVDAKLKDSAGSIFSLDGLNKLKRHVPNITIANGLAWSTDNKYMYYIDSMTRTIDQFDYTATSISNRKSIFSFEKFNIPGFPDGMTVDADGNLWVAVFQGSRVIKIDPRKPDTLLETITFPAFEITSVAFGGKNLDELYVTSARIAFMDVPAPNPPENGATYKVTGLGVKGLPGVNFKMF